MLLRFSITFSPRIPRYIGYGADGSKWFASEMKGANVFAIRHYSYRFILSQICSSLLQLLLRSVPDSSPSHPVTFTRQRLALLPVGTSLTGWR